MRSVCQICVNSYFTGSLFPLHTGTKLCIILVWLTLDMTDCDKVREYPMLKMTLFNERHAMKRFIFFGLFCLFIIGISGCTKPVEIIAHRGASFLAPENTMASVMLGWEKNADVEVDVYLTKDNRIVAIHDETTERTAGTDVNVAESTSDELRKLDVGSFKYEEYAGEQIPFLADIVETNPPGRNSTSKSNADKRFCPISKSFWPRAAKCPGS